MAYDIDPDQLTDAQREAIRAALESLGVTGQPTLDDFRRAVALLVELEQRDGLH